MKNWYTSKTIWIAIIQAAASVVLAFQGVYPEISALLVVKSALDIALRLITSELIK